MYLKISETKKNLYYDKFINYAIPFAWIFSDAILSITHNNYFASEFYQIGM